MDYFNFSVGIMFIGLIVSFCITAWLHKRKKEKHERLMKKLNKREVGFIKLLKKIDDQYLEFILDNVSFKETNEEVLSLRIKYKNEIRAIIEHCKDPDVPKAFKIIIRENFYWVLDIWSELKKITARKKMKKGGKK